MKRVVIIACLAVLAALWASAVFNSSPATSHSTWPSAKGGFVRYGANDTAVGYLLISEFPEEKVNIAGHASFGLGMHSEDLILKPEAKNEAVVVVSLGKTPTFILITQSGEVVSQRWRVSREQFQLFIDGLKTAPTDAEHCQVDSLGVVREVFRTNRDIPVAEILGLE